MRKLTHVIDGQFEDIHRRSMEVLRAFKSDNVFLAEPGTFGSGTASFGNAIVRSAAEVEKTFGGLMTRLWDDPFEWTLPEELKDRPGVTHYFEEVRKTRIKGLTFIVSDDDLLKTIPAPIEMVTVFEVLLNAIARAEHMLGVAAAMTDRGCAVRND